MDDITYTEAVLQEYKVGMGSFSEKLPNVARTFHAFTESCFEEGTLDQKNKQLIALAISVHGNNEYCIIYHTKGCMDAGWYGGRNDGGNRSGCGSRRWFRNEPRRNHLAGCTRRLYRNRSITRNSHQNQVADFLLQTIYIIHA